MFLIQQILDEYILRVAKVNDSTYIINPNIYLRGYDESLAILIQIINDDCVRITDCHVVWDYLAVMGIDPQDYKDKITRILNQFGVSLDGNTLYILKNYTSIDQIHCAINSLIQTIFLIANIELFNK